MVDDDNPTLVARIREAYQPGVKARHVADALGAAYSDVRDAFRSMGWPLRQGVTPGEHKSPTTAGIEEWVRRDPAVSISVVAAHYGVSKQRVSQVITAARITKKLAHTHAREMREPARQTAETARQESLAAAKDARQRLLDDNIEIAARLRSQGNKLQTIADRMGVSIMTACRWCRMHATRQSPPAAGNAVHINQES